jgi:hypothetical protein
MNALSCRPMLIACFVGRRGRYPAPQHGHGWRIFVSFTTLDLSSASRRIDDAAPPLTTGCKLPSLTRNRAPS